MDLSKIEKWISIYNRAVREWINIQLKDVPELNDSNYYYVLLVFENPGVSQKDLIKGIYREQSIVTKAIKFLIEHGWLRREKNAQDRRKSKIFVTEKGRSNYQFLKGIASGASEFATQGLSENEAMQLQLLIKKATKPIL
ncbi:MarR family winged helix-turn-helix transcriptional regulator [Pediococcus claussenii]|uniref:Transcriptional regulator, MarR family n=1 Tax=Pediococcus claussenii (strain ATCC BAA-344 / DSM 14800 / JCM 18046 / KCTC 3811 / LMG 21948 / P06) TaxID=701521 RepID=G8PAQ0_PEDCP|nr:MarR family transcriptional regulator [Pediococcus claussenii]AEV94609.1 Transcriptional regulator, MarR family [Pediococcus claussenii ATCC BAA-344]ANZ69814.1 hypothetical protein AYR57_05605 [Pediococcus claussenii]ANZ71631.1 hypothetical protein AYR58_05610 [Pediococcus claussenii]KRN20789.1 hypothetical protein IV79_GL000009 [Pediococcus claussenii]